MFSRNHSPFDGDAGRLCERQITPHVCVCLVDDDLGGKLHVNPNQCPVKWRVLSARPRRHQAGLNISTS